MGGKRIADQVRGALIQAAKTSVVAVVIDAAGCHRIEPVAECPCEECQRVDGAGQGGAPGTGGKRGFLPDAGSDATSDAGKDGD